MIDHERILAHSFPRPRKGEQLADTMDRAIEILKSICEIGLVLAPEVLEWDLEKMVPGTAPLRLLQKRLCLTEIAISELRDHSSVFGPLALSFDVGKLREAGALPVFYVPQGLGTPLSLMGLFCVNGAHHTKAVLEQLQKLKEWTNPDTALKTFGHPLDDGCVFTLNNCDSAGRVVASYQVPAVQIKHVLQHIGFNNIPFDHSIGVLSVLLNMFCPTDNLHRGEHLGYYRQREWRLIGNDVRFNGRPLGRPLTALEQRRIASADTEFWNRALDIDGKSTRRQELAVLYDPLEEWDPLSLITAVYAPAESVDQVRNAIQNKIPVFSNASPQGRSE